MAHQPMYDYRNQAWTEMRRVYVRCGHREDDQCGCYGRIHEGQALSEGEERRVVRENSD